jgi:2-iminobutanoate/2-iminopropanoate deaminase
MKIIQTPAMPPANGHYSQCIEHNGLLYLSGQLPRDPLTKEMPEGIEAQTRLALQNVQAILAAAGSSVPQIIQVRLYISDIALWDQVNAVYSEFMGAHKPARSVIPTRELHFGALIEVEVLAATAAAG